MNNIGSLLVQMDDSNQNDRRLRAASYIRQTLRDQASESSLVNALYTPRSLQQISPRYYEFLAAQVSEMIRDSYAHNEAIAKAQFTRWNEHSNGKGIWIQSDAELVTQGFTNQAHFCDLLVLGQYHNDPKINSHLPPDFVQSVIIDSSTPAVVVPHTAAFESIGNRILIAWKPTRESQNALRAAIPFLQRAESIHVIADTETKFRASLRHQFETYLQANNIRQSPKFHLIDDSQNFAQRLLSLATDIDSDLLVMGCYGHSRTREAILGGVSKTILSSMKLPVLMAH